MSVKSSNNAEAFDPPVDVHSVKEDDVMEIFTFVPVETHTIDAVSEPSLLVDVVKERFVIETSPSCTQR